MKRFVMAVYDSAAQVFGQPYFVPSLGVAKRGFGDTVNNKESGPLNQHPDDFELYHLGYYEDEDGSLTAIKPIMIERAKDLLVK